MTNQPRKIDGDGTGGYVVRPPKVTDAIGHALRGVFRDDLRLPDEMAVALRRLDRVRH